MRVECIKAKGSVIMDMLDENGQIVERWEKHNLVVALGLKNLSRLIAGDAAGEIVAEIGVGTSGTAPASSDTGLVNQFTKAISGYTFISDSVVQFETTIDAGEANGLTIREGGLFVAGTILFSRTVRSPIVKTGANALNIKWQIQFS